ncbi:MAG: hypothetical protein FJZ01_27620, partial [Candidatus Sericytochromatia bacterium]|nr:hypothetical protein [Candidatus Tanganyikabacteria bacterium]
SAAPAYTLAFRMGQSWETADDRFEIYDQRRWLWLEVRDPAGKPPAAFPAVSIAAPAGKTSPQVYPVQAAAGGRHQARLRFYEPGAGYALTVAVPLGNATQTLTAALPEVLPARREVGSYGLEYRATPARGTPAVPARLRFAAAQGTSAAALPVAPVVKVVNPCGWGPEGTCSAAADVPGAYDWEIPASEVIDVTGNYRIKVYPLSDPATYVEYLYETR